MNPTNRHPILPVTVRTLINVLLFAGLGLFSLMLLTPMVLHTPEAEAIMDSPAAYLFVMATFALVGFLLLALSEWADRSLRLFGRRHHRRWLAYGVIAALLLFVNWGLLVVAKWLLGDNEPFVFPGGGIRLLLIVWLVELVISGLLLANRSAERALIMQQEAARLQEENDRARYEALQAQLNPHFLFNSLNTLVSEIEYDPPSAVQFTLRLSEVYRYVLQNQRLRLVPLSDELEFLHAYLYLHRVRLGDCVSLYNCLPDDVVHDTLVPPLTLQLLAENVLKHNVVSEEFPMVITLSLSANGEYLTVSNPLCPRRSDYSAGEGLRNLANRYRLACKQEIEVQDNREKHTFTVKLPLRYE